MANQEEKKEHDIDMHIIWVRWLYPHMDMDECVTLADIAGGGFGFTDPLQGARGVIQLLWSTMWGPGASAQD